MFIKEKINLFIKADDRNIEEIHFYNYLTYSQPFSLIFCYIIQFILLVSIIMLHIKVFI